MVVTTEVVWTAFNVSESFIYKWEHENGWARHTRHAAGKIAMY